MRNASNSFNKAMFRYMGIVVAIVMFSSSAFSQDWLGSDFQEPLPQYRANTPERVPDASNPNTGQVVTPSPKSSSEASKRAVEELPSRIPSASGNLLAPNPLKSLLGGGKVKSSIPKPIPDKVALPGKTTETIKPERLPSKPAEPKSVFRSRPESLSKSSAGTRPPQSVISKRKQRTSVPQKPVIRYDIYRDTNTFPLDPRKPNNPCTRGSDCGCSNCRLPGVKGKPYKPTEPGGYNCGKKCPHKRPQFSMYWPRPFSAKLDEVFPGKAAARYQPCQKKKLVDVFDCLTNFQLLDYQRIDNGYTGRESDPYGCLGESKIFGLGFRPPGVPNNPAFSSVGYPVGN